MRSGNRWDEWEEGKKTQGFDGYGYSARKDRETEWQSRSDGSELGRASRDGQKRYLKGSEDGGFGGMKEFLMGAKEKVKAKKGGEDNYEKHESHEGTDI